MLVASAALVVVSSAHAQDAGAVSLHTVTFDGRPSHTCQITTHHADENYLFLNCDNGSGTYCYEAFQADLARPADPTPDTPERVIVCPNLGAGMQLVAVTSDAWQLLGARLYATAGDRWRPIVAVAADAIHGPPRELVVRVPTSAGQHTEVLRLTSTDLSPVLSFDSSIGRPGGLTATRADWDPFGPGTVLLSSTMSDHGEDHDTFRVARWDESAGRFGAMVSCPDPRPLIVGGAESVLRPPRISLTSAERRDGWSLRTGTSVLGWTWTTAGCPGVLVRVSALVGAPGAAVPEERAVSYGIVIVDQRSGALRVGERPTPTDSRVAAALRLAPSSAPTPTASSATTDNGGDAIDRALVETHADTVIDDP